MKMLILFALYFTVSIAFELPHSPISTFELDSEARIVNGQIAGRSQFPHQVAILQQRGTQVYFCGGSLICNSWVLTAAHCAYDASNFTIILGAHNIGQQNEVGSVRKSATTKHVHPLYVSIILANDIALIRLDTVVTFSSFIQPIALGNSVLPASVLVTVSGWGKISDASTGITPILRYAVIRTITNAECIASYNLLIVTSRVVCCRGNPDQSTCNGDSGGPLITYLDDKPIQRGIVSFGSNKGCESGNPTGFTRVSSYLLWIRSTIGNTCNLVE